MGCVNGVWDLGGKVISTSIGVGSSYRHSYLLYRPATKSHDPLNRCIRALDD